MREARGEGRGGCSVPSGHSARPRVTGVQLFQAGGVTDPLRHPHAACNYLCKTFWRLGACKGEVAGSRQMGLFLGSRCLEAEQERSCSSALQDATGVRHLPLALAAAGLKAGKFQSGGERRGQYQELSVVGWCSLTSLHSRSRAAGGAVCVLWLWCHQHKGDICPLVTLSPCPDGAKSSLSLCQLRHGTGMPTWQLTPKPDMGGCRQGVAVCVSCFRELSTFTLPGRF